MNDYSEAMKSEDAGPALRKLTEDFALSPGAPPEERFYEDFALLVRWPENGWAIGLKVDFTSDSWSIAEVVALPASSVQKLPPVNTEAMQTYVEAAVSRARQWSREALEQQAKLAASAEFIRQRFEAWRDKTAAKTNVEYAALAAKYAEQIRLGNSRATATLAESVGMSPSVMAQRIKEARRRRLLTRGEKGRASGTLTPLGLLYTDPQFPGFRKLRNSGMTQGGIAARYGIHESYVWAGMMAEGYGDHDFESILETRVPLLGHGNPLSVQDIMRRDDPEP